MSRRAINAQRVIELHQLGLDPRSIGRAIAAEELRLIPYQGIAIDRIISKMIGPRQRRCVALGRPRRIDEAEMQARRERAAHLEAEVIERAGQLGRPRRIDEAEMQARRERAAHLEAEVIERAGQAPPRIKYFRPPADPLLQALLSHHGARPKPKDSAQAAIRSPGAALGPPRAGGK